jgi:hypothetical protein
VTSSFMISTPHQIRYSGDKINNVMGRACSTYEKEEKCIQGFGGKT